MYVCARAFMQYITLSDDFKAGGGLCVACFILGYALEDARVCVEKTSNAEIMSIDQLQVVVVGDGLAVLEPRDLGFRPAICFAAQLDVCIKVSEAVTWAHQ